MRTSGRPHNLRHIDGGWCGRGLIGSIIALTVSAAGCRHGDPFATAGNDAPPLHDGGVTRITFATSPDELYGWLPDGTGILYGFEDRSTGLTDLCLGVLPPAGGGRASETCSRSVGSRDSLDSYTGGAVSPGGRLAFAYSQKAGVNATPGSNEIRLTDFPGSSPHVTVHPLPYSIDGTKVDGARMLLWLGETILVYQALRQVGPAAFAPIGLVAVNIESCQASLVPGGDLLLSYAASGDSAIVATRAGSSIVWHVTVPDGLATPLWDFAPSFPSLISLSDPLLVARTAAGLEVVNLIDATTSLIDPGNLTNMTGISLRSDGRLAVESEGDIWLMELAG